MSYKYDTFAVVAINFNSLIRVGKHLEIFGGKPQGAKSKVYLISINMSQCKRSVERKQEKDETGRNGKGRLSHGGCGGGKTGRLDREKIYAAEHYEFPQRHLTPS